MSQVIDLNVEIAHIKNLPPLPEESVRIVTAVNDPDISIDALVDVISVSPSLTARLLGLSNSAFFGRVKPINDLRTAIIQVLGLNLVKSLVLSIALNVELDTTKCELFDSRFYWNQALLTAYIAQKISTNVDNEQASPATMYTTGLLLNIGLLAAIHTIPEEMNEIFARSERESGSVSEQMQEHFGLNQYELGGVLLGMWKLPQIYQTILKQFRQSDFSGEEKGLVDVLELSHSLAYYIATDKHDEIPCLSDWLQKLALDSAVVDDVVAEIISNKENIKELATFFSG